MAIYGGLLGVSTWGNKVLSSNFYGLLQEWESDRWDSSAGGSVPHVKVKVCVCVCRCVSFISGLTVVFLLKYCSFSQNRLSVKQCGTCFIFRVWNNFWWIYDGRPVLQSRLENKKKKSLARQKFCFIRLWLLCPQNKLEQKIKWGVVLENPRLGIT